MTANEIRGIKGKLMDKLMDQGFKVVCTGTSDITMFTDKQVNPKSIKYHKGNHGYITSWGVRGALKFLEVQP